MLDIEGECGERWEAEGVVLDSLLGVPNRRDPPLCPHLGVASEVLCMCPLRFSQSQVL